MKKLIRKKSKKRKKYGDYHPQGKCKFCGGATCRKESTRCKKCYHKSRIIHFKELIDQPKKRIKKYKQKWEKEHQKESYKKKRNKWLKLPRTKRYKIKANYSLLAKYKITLEEYLKLLKKQKDRCAICGLKYNKKKEKFHIDHNHKTGKVRGILCFKCNVAIGHLNDDIKLVKKALRYLRGG